MSSAAIASALGWRKGKKSVAYGDLAGHLTTITTTRAAEGIKIGSVLSASLFRIAGSRVQRTELRARVKIGRRAKAIMTKRVKPIRSSLIAVIAAMPASMKEREREERG